MSTEHTGSRSVTLYHERKIAAQRKRVAKAWSDAVAAMSAYASAESALVLMLDRHERRLRVLNDPTLK